MVDRYDPARTGVKAGRVVGVLTAGIAVVSLVRIQDSFYEVLAALLGVVGIESGLSVTVLFWGNVVLAAGGRFALGYVVGSLVGVVYDWLDEPPLAVLVVLVLAVGLVDGSLAALDTQSGPIGAAYLFAWLCFVPAFVWLLGDADEYPSGPRRLGE